MPTYYVFCRRLDNLRDGESNAIYLYYELNKLHDQTSTLVCDFGYPRLFTKIKLEKNIRNKIKENQKLFSYEIVEILEKIKEEIKIKPITETTKNSYLEKVNKFIDFFDSNEEFFKSINYLVRKKLEDPENPDNEIYWTQALKAFSARLEKRINDNKSIANVEERKTHFVDNIQPLIKQLIKIFLLHSEYFAAARYKAIAVCEELLVHNLQENNLHLKLLYMLANLHSYRGNYWRRKPYKSRFDELKQQLDPNEVFFEIQTDEEAAHNGLRRLLHYMQNVPTAHLPKNLEKSGRRTDAYKLNVFSINLDIQNHKIVSLQDKDGDSSEERQISISRWNNIPDFAVLTGINGIGKTKILDSLNEELKRLYSVNDPRIAHHLYLNAESDILRNVFGKKGNDFKLEYVYEKLIFYLDFDDYKKRAIVNQRSEENLSCKIALAIADRIFCGKCEGNWFQILQNLKRTVGKTDKISLIKSHFSIDYILQLAEELAFKLNAILEPISFVKNICWQHLQLVKSKYKEHHPQILERENNNYYDIECGNYCENLLAIINPIKNINALLRKYLKDFEIKYKWVPYYKYRLLYDEYEQPDSSEIGLFLENEELKCRIVDKDLPLTITKEKISEEIYNKIVEAVKTCSYINLDNEIERIVEFTSSYGYTPGNYELIFLKGGIDVHPQNLSSGEITIIKLILWAYVSKGLNYNNRIHEIYSKEQIRILDEDEDTIEHNTQQEDGHLLYIKRIKYEEKQNSLIEFKTKLELMLLDEIDKHFDSRMSRVLIDILKNEFVHEYGKSQVIITSHKPDSLALVPADKHCRIFTVQQNYDQAEIVETHKLLAMFRLTGNMREITNFHIRVFTEAPDDMQFYDGIHKVLLRYCEAMRLRNIGKVISQEMSTMASRYWGNLQGKNIYQWNNRLLSKRYQPSFAATAVSEDDSGGGKSGIKSILPRELIMRQKQSSFYEQKDNPIELIDPIVESPFAIMDADYDNLNRRDIDNDSVLRGRVIFLNRHSLENYLFDPWIVFSLVTKEEIKEFFGLTTFYYKCRNCIDYINRIKKGESTNDLGDPLRVYLSYVIQILLETLGFQRKNGEILKNPIYTTIRICQIFSKLNGEELFNAMTASLDKNIPQFLFKILAEALNIPESECRKYKSYSENSTYKEFNLLKLIISTYKIYKNISYTPSTAEIVKYIMSQAKEIDIIYNPSKPALKFQYPILFLKLRGHDIEAIVLKVISQDNVLEKQNLKDYLLSKLYSVSSLWMPVDLANVFFELNSKLREQIYPTLKGIQVSDKAETALLRLEVRAKVKLPYTHRLDVPYATKDQALNDHLQGLLGYKISDYHPYMDTLNLKRTEKDTFSHLTDKLMKTIFKYEYKLTADHSVKLKHNTENASPHIVITLFSEASHVLFHGENVLSLIVAIKNEGLRLDTLICLERKQYGNNLGMSDVITLANYLKQGNALPVELQQLPIYHDALLYNAAKAKGVQVVGIEGKGLAYSKESPYYHQAREEYMAEQLLAITRSGKNAIFLVGAAHINNLIELLGAQGFRVDYSDSSLGQNLITLKPELAIFTKELTLSGINTDLVRIANNEHRVENSPELKTEHLLHKAVQSYSFLSYILGFAEQFDLNWQVQKLLHLTDLWKFDSLKAKYGITASFDAFRGSNSDFRKSVLLKLHPDKNPGNPDCNDDFIFVTNLREELNKPFDVQKFINEKIQTIQPFIYKAHIGLKAFDITIDTTRLIYTPTIDNAKRVLTDGAHIYSMHSGINGISTIINGADVLYKVYQGEYGQALTQGLTTTGYMLVPAAISFVAIPYVGFIYGITLTIYSGYGAINNAYSFYQEYYEENSGLRSITAYKNLFETLSYSLLQYVYDFSKTAKEYKAKTNNIKLELEKAHIKGQLEEKGNFGQKLYEYIYTRVIEEKYDLLNKVIQGILTQEDAKALKAKHIKVLDYDHCMEVMELKEEQSDHYYCYNEEQEILDHIIIAGETYIEKVGSL